MNIKKILLETDQLLLSGENEKAEINYKNIIKLDPNNFIAYGNLGYLYLLKKKLQ
jgi:Flp pilus assembly protein TadD